MYRLEDLNLRPTEYESVVLPTELKRFLAVEVGFEPTNRISAIADLAGRWVKPLPHSTILFLRLHYTIPYNSTRSVFTSHSLIIDLWLPTVTPFSFYPERSLHLRFLSLLQYCRVPRI